MELIYNKKYYSKLFFVTQFNILTQLLDLNSLNKTAYNKKILTVEPLSVSIKKIKKRKMRSTALQYKKRTSLLLMYQQLITHIYRY
jgi:hypothetical protein